MPHPCLDLVLSDTPGNGGSIVLDGPGGGGGVSCNSF